MYICVCFVGLNVSKGSERLFDTVQTDELYIKDYMKSCIKDIAW
jgi:hypothetical protein